MAWVKIDQHVRLGGQIDRDRQPDRADARDLCPHRRASSLHSGLSMAATTSNVLSCLASAINRVPMRPQAPVMASLIMIVCPVCWAIHPALPESPSNHPAPPPADSTASRAAHFLRKRQILHRFHVDPRVIFHRGVGILQLVASENADDRFIFADGLILQQLMAKARDTGRGTGGSSLSSP